MTGEKPQIKNPMQVPPYEEPAEFVVQLLAWRLVLGSPPATRGGLTVEAQTGPLASSFGSRKSVESGLPESLPVIVP